MIQLVAEDGILGSRQGRENAEIGHVATGENKGRLGPFPGGQVVLQAAQRLRVAGHKGRGTCSAAVAPGSGSSGAGQARVRGQAEVIVGREVDQLPSVNPNADTLRGVQSAPPAVQAAAGQVVQGVVHPGRHGSRLAAGHA